MPTASLPRVQRTSEARTSTCPSMPAVRAKLGFEPGDPVAPDVGHQAESRAAGTESDLEPGEIEALHRAHLRQERPHGPQPRGVDGDLVGNGVSRGSKRPTPTAPSRDAPRCRAETQGSTLAVQRGRERHVVVARRQAIEGERPGPKVDFDFVTVDISLRPDAERQTLRGHPVERGALDVHVRRLLEAGRVSTEVFDAPGRSQRHGDVRPGGLCCERRREQGAHVLQAGRGGTNREVDGVAILDDVERRPDVSQVDGRVRDAATAGRMRSVDHGVPEAHRHPRRGVGEQSAVAPEHVKPGGGRFDLDGVGSVPLEERVSTERESVGEDARRGGARLERGHGERRGEISPGGERRGASAEVLGVEVDVTAAGHDSRRALERGSGETCFGSAGHRPVCGLEAVEGDGEIFDAEGVAAGVEPDPLEPHRPLPREAAVRRLRTKRGLPPLTASAPSSRRTSTLARSASTVSAPPRERPRTGATDSDSTS